MIAIELLNLLELFVSYMERSICEYDRLSQSKESYRMICSTEMLEFDANDIYLIVF